MDGATQPTMPSRTGNKRELAAGAWGRQGNKTASTSMFTAPAGTPGRRRRSQSPAGTGRPRRSVNRVRAICYHYEPQARELRSRSICRSKHRRPSQSVAEPGDSPGQSSASRSAGTRPVRTRGQFSLLIAGIPSGAAVSSLSSRSRKRTPRSCAAERAVGLRSP
jgi:hypothetical protein